MKKVPLLLLTALVLLCLALVSLFHAPPTGAQGPKEPARLFELVGDERQPSAPGEAASPASVREQEIGVNLDGVDLGAARELGLPLLGGRLHHAVRNDAEGFDAAADGGRIWRGKIFGDGGFAGDVTLTAKGGALAGLIYAPEGVFEIIPQAGFKHLLVELDQSRFPACGGALPARPAGEGGEPTAGAPSESSTGTAGDDGTFLDVLVVYTAGVRTALGGTTQAQTFAHQSVNSTNTAYINSGIAPRLRLVSAQEVAYDEAPGTLSAALDWVRSDAGVAAARNAARADIVAILIENASDACGLAYVMRNVGPGFANSAFSATARACAVGNLSFAHELGHNQGCEHNPENSAPPASASYPYAYGHYVNGSFRTVMSYVDPCPSGCPRVPHFSNPSVNFNGVPTGIADQRDTRRVINNTALTMSQFRDSGGAGPVAPANDNFANAQAVGGETGNAAGANLNATKETGEPGHGGNTGGASVWYNWTAPASGLVTLTTSGANFDTLLGVYTGASVGGLMLVAGNDDDPSGGLSSRVTFTAVGGTTYRIAVDGYAGAAGSFTLNWGQVAVCTYSVSPAIRSFTSGGGPGTVNVTATAGCAWTASSDSSWAAITSGAAGTGDGTINYSVAPNPLASMRGGSLTILGVGFRGTHDISQDVAVYTLSIASVNPSTNVGITVTPNSREGLGNGGTPFTRTYNNLTSVTLTAPATSTAGAFQKWQRDGVDLTTNRAATVTMDANQALTAVYSPQPSQVSVTVQSNPAGRVVTVDGVNYNAPQTFSWAPGSAHTIAVSSPQSGAAGTRYVWAGWSDGGAVSHTVAPAAGATYTANFTTQHLLTMNSAAGGTASPAGAWFNAGQAVSISATPAAGYAFAGWTGGGAGSYTGANNPATLTMNGPVTETPAFRQQSSARNVALASNGATASASSTLDAGRLAAAVINGDRRGVNWGTNPAAGSGWHDATADAHPDWVQVNFGGAKTINEIDVFTIQDNYASPSEPTEQTSFTLYGVTAFEVQYDSGAGVWVTVPGGSVAGNNKVWRKFTFAPVTASRVRVLVNGALAGYSRVVEVEAYEAGGTTPPPPPAETSGTNVALASNGAVATASSTLDAGRAASGANNGDRRGLNWGAGGGWHDATANAHPDWLQVDFAGAQTIDRIEVFTIQDNYANPSEPTATTPFSLYGITAFDVQYWNGAAWATVPGGSVTGNNLVRRTFTFPALLTSKIRVLVNGALAGYSRIVEVEAYAPKVNVAHAANGGTATASSTLDAGRPVSAVNNGDRRGLNWGAGGGWHDATANAYPDWVQVNFGGTKTISEVLVFTIQDNYASPSEPTDQMTFGLYGVTAFDVQYWNGSAWVTVPGGSVTGNNLVKRSFTFAPVNTDRVRVVVNNALAGYSRLTEVEVY